MTWVLLVVAIIAIALVVLVLVLNRMSIRIALEKGPATEFTRRLNAQLSREGRNLEPLEERVLGLPYVALSPTEREYFRRHVDPMRETYRSLLKRAFLEEGYPYEEWAAILRRPFEPLVETLVKEALREIRAGILD
jgi:hypothetical protein